MSDSFSIYLTSAGQATTSAGPATLLPANSRTAVLRIVCDGYLRIQFGGNSVVASIISSLFAPGELYVTPPTGSLYYSVLAVTGTVNYSIDLGVTADNPR